MNIFKLPNGDLRIQLEDSDDRDELAYAQENLNYRNIWRTLTEPYWANGSFEFFSPVDQSPSSALFVGLTSIGHAIAESIDYTDDGPVITGDWWYFNDTYDDPFELLMENWFVDFKLAR